MNTLIRKSLALLAGMLLPLAVAAQTQATSDMGKIIDIDEQESTITIETSDGFEEYEVDDNLEITETGPMEGTTRAADMTVLELGDVVRVTDTAEGRTPDRLLAVRVERQRPQMTAQAERDEAERTDPGAQGDDGRTAARDRLPQTASPLPLIGLAGFAAMGLAGVLHLVRRKRTT